MHGRFVGKVTVADRDYFTDALLTLTGAVRLYVGGAYSPSGALQTSPAEGSLQFVGRVDPGNPASVGGVVIGEGCASSQDIRFCGQAVPAEISIEVIRDNLQGEIHVATKQGTEIWLLDLGSWDNYYVLPAAQESLAGQYEEKLAEFALDGDTIMNVDSTGQLFLQSPHSGCIGNGTLTPNGWDGAFNVYAVAVNLESCATPYAYLNGRFEGLATTTPSGYWDYDSLLRIWLSTPDGAPSHAAVTMLGQPL